MSPFRSMQFPKILDYLIFKGGKVKWQRQNSKETNPM
jgi:hypothetical protein